MSTQAQVEVEVAAVLSARKPPVGVLRRSLANKSVLIGATVIILIVLMGIAAPWLGTMDPTAIDPTFRNRVPGTEHVIKAPGGGEATWVYRMGTDSLGRDVYSRVVYGARISILVGIAVAVLATVIGMAIGLIAGYTRWVDAIVMRIMDGLMAIPPILLAIGLVSAWGAGLGTVIFAIAVPQVPLVVRLVRSIVLTIREEPYVEAAVSVGTPLRLILWRHVMPNTLAPMIVQATFICASAIVVEAILSFLGVGIPTEIPTWGNIMADGRQLFRVYSHAILYPGIFLAITVLAVNMLGDGLRDTLDPRLAKRI